MNERKPTTRRGQARIRIETRADEPTATGRFSLDIHLTKEHARRLLIQAIEYAAAEERELSIGREDVGHTGKRAA